MPSDNLSFYFLQLSWGNVSFAYLISFQGIESSIFETIIIGALWTAKTDSFPDYSLEPIKPLVVLVTY